MNNILEVEVEGNIGNKYRQRKVWCRHCLQYLGYGTEDSPGLEAAAHVNMFRATRTCMTCGISCYLDETEEVKHSGVCSGPNLRESYPVAVSNTGAVQYPAWLDSRIAGTVFAAV